MNRHAGLKQSPLAPSCQSQQNNEKNGKIENVDFFYVHLKIFVYVHSIITQNYMAGSWKKRENKQLILLIEP